MRVALVTGAARGIGAATVEVLCEQGYAVTAVDAATGEDVPPGVGYPMASRADLERLAERWPERVFPVVADVREPEALRDAVAATVDRFGHLDAAVAAAGVVVGGKAQWETPTDHLCTLIDVNVFGAWHTAAAAIPALLAAPDPTGGRFVAVASVAGDRGLFHLTGYCASKHAVIGIVRGLAADLAGTGVTAVAVSPGSTDTAMLAATADLYGTSPADLTAHQGVRRALRPAEIATTIALCCSRDGAALNGSVVHADGGFGL
jgi:SDR family mycofactocin-dependent oxidoreductase